jgi:ribose-phosphate pyrophosphokinase
MPVEQLSAVGLLAERARAALDGASVVVAPDLGAVKLAERYATALKLPLAVVHKTRQSGSEVRAERIVGEVRGRRPLVVDDLIASGGTIEAAARALLDAGARAPFNVVASHGLFVEPARARLRDLPIARYLVSDSVPAPAVELPIERVALAPLLARSLAHLHRDFSYHHA